ncbi:helix-turn-helix transcriptional regulator [Streptomyces sp. SID9944]|nr:helix-turn-helix transcriptional regulator [Streptomyces sp. SID9944]
MFKWIMENPGRGKPYSIRTLAEASGCGRNVVAKLANGTQDSADAQDAHSLVDALGVALLVLFAPNPSPELDEVSPADAPTQKE